MQVDFSISSGAGITSQDFSPQVIARAFQIPSESIRVLTAGERYLIGSSNSDKTYTVTIYDEHNFIGCSCRHGMNNPGRSRCSHVYKVLETLGKL